MSWVSKTTGLRVRRGGSKPTLWPLSVPGQAAEPARLSPKRTVPNLWPSRLGQTQTPLAWAHPQAEVLRLGHCTAPGERSSSTVLVLPAKPRHCQALKRPVVTTFLLTGSTGPGLRTLAGKGIGPEWNRSGLFSFISIYGKWVLIFHFG